jgi:hypothetical protein
MVAVFPPYLELRLQQFGHPSLGVWSIHMHGGVVPATMARLMEQGADHSLLPIVISAAVWGTNGRSRQRGVGATMLQWWLLSAHTLPCNPPTLIYISMILILHGVVHSSALAS